MIRFLVYGVVHRVGVPTERDKRPRVQHVIHAIGKTEAIERFEAAHPTAQDIIAQVAT